MSTPLMLTLGSVAALLPATVFLVAGVVFFIGAVAAIVDGKLYLSSGGVDYEFLYLTLSYAAGVFAIWQFWVLAIATIREREASISWRLWIAIACGCISAVGVSLIGGASALVLVVLPVCILVGWLLRLQYRRRLQ